MVSSSNAETVGVRLKSEVERTVLAATDREVTAKDEVDEVKDLLKHEEEHAKDPCKKPAIDHLDDAVVFLSDGTPVFVPEIGERVIIERYTSLLPGRPWLDTKLYLIRDVDQETGHLSLWDEETQHWVVSNFADGLQSGYRFKLPPDHGRGIPKKKHRRTKEERRQAKEDSWAQMATKKKSRRGRPKGSKNRDKAVIQAEKLERMRIRTEKAEKRDLKKRIAQAVAITPTRVIAAVGTDGKKKRRNKRIDIGRVKRVVRRRVKRA